MPGKPCPTDLRARGEMDAGTARVLQAPEDWPDSMRPMPQRTTSDRLIASSEMRR
jgi:hypothetical protein